MSTAHLLRFLVRRIIGLLLVLAILVLATFALVRLVPGDPARVVAGADATQSDVAAVREELGLTKPFGTQFFDYVKGLPTLNLGKSFITSERVSTIIGRAVPVTLKLVGGGVLLAFVVATLVGILAGAYTRDHRHRGAEIAFTSLASVGAALPEYVVATILVVIFGIWLRVLPVAGHDTPQSFILPIVAVASHATFVLMRVIRLETVNVLSQEYIQAARSKRLRTSRIYLRHVAPNVMTPALTIGGLQIAGLMGGTVVVESVFGLHGLGSTMVTAVIQHDYPLIQGAILVFGVAVVAVTALVDLLIVLVDPRTATTES